MNDKLLTKEDILKASDIKTHRVSVPEWGGDVIVRSMTASEYDAFEQSLFNEKRKIIMADARAKLVVASVVDENGKQMFSIDDITQLNAKSVKPMDRIVDVARKLNGTTESDLEEMVKNSNKMGDEDSSSS